MEALGIIMVREEAGGGGERAGYSGNGGNGAYSNSNQLGD